MPLLDQYGNPIDINRLKVKESGPTIAGVRQIISDHPWQGMTPQRLARCLRLAEEGDSTAYLELAEDLEEKDLHYRAVLSTRRLQVSQLPITIEAASDAAEDQAAAALARDLLIDSGVVTDYLFDMLDAIAKGWSVGEIAWQLTAARWQPIRIEWCDPRWVEFDRADGRTVLLKGGVSGIGPADPLKPFGYVVHCHKSKSGLPVRGGIARAAAWLVLFKNLDIKGWLEFLEGYGQPVRLGKYQTGASEKDKETLLRAVRSMWKDSAAIIPAGMEIQWLEARVGIGGDLQRDFADWCDRQISKLILGQTGTTDVGQHVGTANAHDKVKDDIERDDAAQLAATLNRDLVRPLIDLNLGRRDRYPRLKIERPDAVDLKLYMDTVKTFVELGGEVEQSVVRDKIGLPDPPEAGADGKPVKLLRPNSPQQQATADPAAADPAAADPEPARLTTQAQEPAIRSGDALDGLAEEALSDWELLMTPVVDPVRRLLDECRTAEEFQRRLPEVLGAMDMDKVVDALSRACFVARAAGETEAEIG